MQRPEPSPAPGQDAGAITMETRAQPEAAAAGGGTRPAAMRPEPTTVIMMAELDGPIQIKGAGIG